ncbi:MAG: DUF6069 family protein [Trueperaceae bacterium]
MTTQSAAPKPSIGKFLQAGLIGGVVGTVVNLIFYFVGNAVNGAPLSIDAPGPQGVRDLPIFPIVLFSLIPGIGAGLMYGIIRRFTANARMILLVLSAIIIVATFFGPLRAAQTTVTMWILQIMHFGAALPILAMLFRADT